MKFFCMLTLVLLLNSSRAQLLRSPPTVNLLGIGAYSGNFTDVFSFTTNQAALSKVKSTSAGVFSEQKFMLSELKRFSGAVIFPCFSGGAGISLDHAGFDQYTESHAGIAYGRSLGEKIDFGAQVNYYRVNIDGYGNAATINFELGLVTKFTDKMFAGLHVYNPVGGRYGIDFSEKIASAYSFALGYEVSEILLFTGTITKVTSQPVNLNISFQYFFLKQSFLRGGTTTATRSYYAGIGLRWKDITVAVAADWHARIGVTPGLLLICQLLKPKPEQ